MWVVSTFLLILCNASKSANSSDFIFLSEWFKRNADWRVQTDSCCQRAKVHRLETQPGWSVKCYVLAMLQLIFFQSAFIFLDTCVIFHEIMFFKELSAFIALYFIQGALFPSWRFISWLRAFVQVFLSAGKRFIIALSLIIALYSNFSKCRKALYHSAFTQVYLSKCLFFILLSMENASAIISISWCAALNFLIMLWDFLIFLYV